MAPLASRIQSTRPAGTRFRIDVPAEGLCAGMAMKMRRLAPSVRRLRLALLRHANRAQAGRSHGVVGLEGQGSLELALRLSPPAQSVQAAAVITMQARRIRRIFDGDSIFGARLVESSL